MSSSKRPPPGASSQHAGSGSPFEQQAKRHKTAAPEQDVGPKLQEKMLKDVQLKDLAAELQSRAKSTLMELETRIHAGDISCIEEFEAVHDLLQDTSGEIATLVDAHSIKIPLFANVRDMNGNVVMDNIKVHSSFVRVSEGKQRKPKTSCNVLEKFQHYVRHEAAGAQEARRSVVDSVFEEACPKLEKIAVQAEPMTQGEGSSFEQEAKLIQSFIPSLIRERGNRATNYGKKRGYNLSRTEEELEAEDAKAREEEEKAWEGTAPNVVFSEPVETNKGAGRLWMLTARACRRDLTQFEYLIVFTDRNSCRTELCEFRREKMKLDERDGAWMYDKTYTASDGRDGRERDDQELSQEVYGDLTLVTPVVSVSRPTFLFSYRDPSDMMPTRFAFKDQHTSRVLYRQLQAPDLVWALAVPNVDKAPVAFSGRDEYGWYGVFDEDNDCPHDEMHYFDVKHQANRDDGRVWRPFNEREWDPDSLKEKFEKHAKEIFPEQIFGKEKEILEDEYDHMGSDSDSGDSHYNDAKGKTLPHYNSAFSDGSTLSVLSSGRTDAAAAKFDEELEKGNNLVFQAMRGDVHVSDINLVTYGETGQILGATITGEEGYGRSLLDIVKLGGAALAEPDELGGGEKGRIVIEFSAMVNLSGENLDWMEKKGRLDRKTYGESEQEDRKPRLVERGLRDEEIVD